MPGHEVWNDPPSNVTVENIYFEEIPLDLLVLSVGGKPRKDSGELARTLRISCSSEGFFQEAHVKLRPVDCASEGIFVCGAAHYPKSIDETISQAFAAAGRAAAMLARPVIKAGGVVEGADRIRPAPHDGERDGDSVLVGQHVNVRLGVPGNH